MTSTDTGISPERGMDPSHDDKRQELRLCSDDSVFVEMAELDAASGTQSRIALCEGLDYSANGLRVRMDEAPSLGSILRICIQPAGTDSRLYLSAETMWRKVDSDGAWQVGFSLFESDDTDIESWKVLVASRIC